MTEWKTNEQNPDSKLKYCDVKKSQFVNYLDFFAFVHENKIINPHGLYDILLLNGEVRLYAYKE
jgi:hypothetical protein